MFDFELPSSLDQSWDTTLKGVCDGSPEVKAILPTEQGAVQSEKSSFVEQDAQGKDDEVPKEGGSEQEPKNAVQKKQLSKLQEEVSEST